MDSIHAIKARNQIELSLFKGSWKSQQKNGFFIHFCSSLLNMKVTVFDLLAVNTIDFKQQFQYK